MLEPVIWVEMWVNEAIEENDREKLEGDDELGESWDLKYLGWKGSIPICVVLISLQFIYFWLIVLFVYR
jgi:hypothetical protein